MECNRSRQVISISDYRRSADVGERMRGMETAGQEESGRELFPEIFLDLLMEERRTVISYIGMKLDARRRKCFRDALGNCEGEEDERRCVKNFLHHLSIKDVNALLVGLRRMAISKTGATVYSGERKRESRQIDFAEKLRMRETDVNEWLTLCFLTIQAGLV